jgi:phytoene dehydrogenase-like protein
MKDRAYDVAIIGAGPNGLICGAYLAKAGLKVILLENRHETGGGLDTLEFAGFTYNPHAIYHMMAEIMPAYKDFDLKSRGVRYIFPDVQAAYISKTEKPLILYRDPQKTADFISSEFSEKDGREYARMYADFKAYCDKILIPLTYVPAVPPIDQIQAMHHAKNDLGKRFNEIAELPPLDLLEMGYYFPIMVYRMTNAALCCGGSHRLSSALHKAVVEHGGAISDESRVVKVLTTSGRVSGVVIDDGTEIDAKAVVSTVDPHQTFLEFFDDGEIPEGLRESARKWEWEKISLFGVHLALKQAPQYIGTEQFDDANHAMMTFLGIEDTDSVLRHHRSLEEGELPTKDLYGHTTCASVFDPIQAPPGMHTGRWECLAPYDIDWDKNKWEFAHMCIDQWKGYAPNLEYINTLIYPPTYIEKKVINMVKGSIKQGAYIPLQMGYFRPNEECSQSYTPIDGLYVCGASAYPGGMILGGGGYIGANTIVDDFGVKKAWDEPEIVKQAREDGFIE